MHSTESTPWTNSNNLPGARRTREATQLTRPSMWSQFAIKVYVHVDGPGAMVSYITPPDLTYIINFIVVVLPSLLDKIRTYCFVLHSLSTMYLYIEYELPIP
jgi:hypothetical protein